jgi:hypothetical protein
MSGFVNPYRSEVLAMYHKIIRAAFLHNWNTDEDAMYVLHEARRLFRQNQHIQDVETIGRKVREAEMRHGLAVHYSIPYPRMYHKVAGSNNVYGGSIYAPYMDSLYDTPANPQVERCTEGAPVALMPGETGSKEIAPDDVGAVPR